MRNVLSLVRRLGRLAPDRNLVEPNFVCANMAAVNTCSCCCLGATSICGCGMITCCCGGIACDHGFAGVAASSGEIRAPASADDSESIAKNEPVTSALCGG